MNDPILEATVALAPEKPGQALMTTIAATRMFILLYDREPSTKAVRDRFIREATDLACTDADIQWLVDAELIDSDIFDQWKAANREHA